MLGGSWGGIIGIRAKTDAIVEILEPIEHRNSAGNASGTRTEGGTWDLTFDLHGASTIDNLPFGRRICICVMLTGADRGSLVGGKKSTRSLWIYGDLSMWSAGGKICRPLLDMSIDACDAELRKQRE